MALDSRYIASIAFQQFLVDKNTGLPLSGGYIEFYEDNSRLTPKNVFQLTGSPPNYTYSPLSNPLFLSDVGTTINDSGDEIPVYFFPYDEDGEIENYYIKIFNSEGVEQYTLQAWPGLTEQDSVNNLNNAADNQISNSQFVQVNFIPEEGMVITFDSALSAESFAISKDWELIITSGGAGSVTVNQIALEGSLQIRTNPPYTLSILPSGATITRLILRQRLNHNPSVFSSTLTEDGYLAGCMLVTSLDGQSHTLEMQYAQSSGPSSPQTIVSGSTLTSGYQFLNATVLLDAGTNTDSSDDGAAFIDIILPTTGYYALTSIQVISLDINILVDYQQETVNRQIDHLFHSYKEPLEFKPIKSYLCGWDFPLNPAQPYGSSTSVGSVASNYVWDQTIIYQSVNPSVSVTRATTGKIKGCLNIEVGSTCQLAVIQYLTVPQILDLLSNPLSSNIIFSSNQASLSGMISLWYTEDLTLPNINTDGKSLVVSLNSSGKPVAFNGNWTEINRSNFGDAIFTKSTSTDLNNLESFGFNGWELDLDDVNLSLVTYFAIVIGFSSVTATNNVVLQSCSLVPGTIATPPAPQTENDVLKDCEYYYEKSYDSTVTVGTVTLNGAVYSSVPAYYNSGTNQTTLYASGFVIIYRSSKVSLPIISFYSPGNGTLNYVLFQAGGSGSSNNFDITTVTSVYGSSLKAKTYEQTSPTATLIVTGSNLSGVMYYHYVADSRLGIY